MVPNTVTTLAVSRVCRQDKSMIRFPFFYIGAFLVTVGLIGLALWPMKPRTYEAIEARVDGEALVIDGPALSNIKPAEGFAVTPFPGPRGDQTGPRLASVSALAPGAQYSKGARLLLGPKTLAAISGKPVSVTIVARGVAKSPATKMGFGLVADGPISWGQIAVTQTFAPIRFDVPAGNQPLKGLAFWPAVEGQGHGIEITSIALQPL
jgi:hypothetical protein